jgi:ABC-type branched-subunit amino acid transport system substrate-binding protein
MYCDTAYDATMLAALAIAHAGEYDGTKIKNSLEYVSQFYIGATGHKMFDKNGDQLTQFYEIWDVVKEDGKYKFIRIGTWPE